MSERRKSPRIQAEFKIDMHVDSDVNEAFAFVKNISTGGLYLQTKHLLGPNDKVTINFKLPNQKKKGNLTVVGQVIHLTAWDSIDDPSQTEYGAGVRFLSFSSEVEDALEEFLSHV